MNPSSTNDSRQNSTIATLDPSTTVPLTDNVSSINNTVFPSLISTNLLTNSLLSSPYFASLNPYAVLQQQQLQLQQTQSILNPSNILGLLGALPQLQGAANNGSIMTTNLVRLLGASNSRALFDLFDSLAPSLATDPASLALFTQLMQTQQSAVAPPTPIDNSNVTSVLVQSTYPPATASSVIQSLPESIPISEKQKTSSLQSRKRKSQDARSNAMKKASITTFENDGVDNNALLKRPYNYRTDPFVLAFLFLNADTAIPENRRMLEKFDKMTDRLLAKEFGVNYSARGGKDDGADFKDLDKELNNFNKLAAGHFSQSSFRRVSSSSNSIDEQSSNLSKNNDSSTTTDSIIIQTEEIDGDSSPGSHASIDEKAEVTEFTPEHPDYANYLPVSLPSEIFGTSLLYMPSNGLDVKQYPPLWYGQLAMKTNDTQLGLYYIGGNKELFYRSFGPAPQSGQKKTVIKVNQRMRLDQSQSIVHKLQDVERHVTCVGVCAGVNPDNCRENEIKLKSHFINYFNQKEIAGIALTTEEPPFEASRVHIFAPGPLAANYLQVHAPSLYNHLQSKEMAFLFFIISPPE